MSYVDKIDVRLDYDVATDIAAQYLIDCLEDDHVPYQRREQFINACKEVLHFIMLPDEWEEMFGEDFVEFAGDE